MRFVLSVFLVLAIAFSAYAQQTDEWYQGKPIRRIVFEGLLHVSSLELEGITEQYINKPFNDETYWDILGRLYALEYFESITPVAVRADSQGSEVILRFTVVERPTVSRINFAGNSGVKRNELSDTVSIK